MTDVTLRYLLLGEDRSASKATQAVATSAQKAAATAGASFSRMGGVIGGELGHVLGVAGEGLTHIGDVAKGMGPKLQVAGLGLASVGVGLQALGSANVQADKQLEATFEAAGESLSDYQDQIDKTVKSNQNFARSDDDTKNALSTLVQATQDPTKALKEMGLVADLAAAKHTSLQSASNLVARALGGNGRIFKQYGIEVKKTADGTSDYQGALDELAQRLHGQAAASVDTFSGKLDVLKTKVADGAAEFGAKYGPAITAAGAVMTIFGTVLEITRGRQLANAAAAAVAAAAEEGQTVVTGQATAAQWSLNAALTANPIGLIVVAIGALVAGLILAYKHSETFRVIVNAAFHAVQTAASFAFNFIKDHWKLLLSIITGPIGAATIFVLSHWKQISNGARSAVANIKDFFAGIPAWFGGLAKKVSSKFSGMFDGIPDAFRAALRSLENMWNNVHLPSISIAGHKIGGGHLPPLHIPGLANGGVLKTAGSVVVGDGGKPEILSLPAGAQVTPLSHAGSGGDVNVYIDGALDPVAVGRQVREALLLLKRTNGGAQLGLA